MVGQFNVLGLLSGGKDSCYNLLECARLGHRIVAVANLAPRPKTDENSDRDEEELDSFCFQTVGYGLVPAIADALDIPLIQHFTDGHAVHTGVTYPSSQSYDDSKGDEVEDLFRLVADAKQKFPCINAVASGAILSNYQRNRVENVCSRLNLTSVAFLWQRDQETLLQDMIDSDIEAVLVKIASVGLKHAHLGKSLTQMHDILMRLNAQFGVNVCGEGGEYETLTLDCPLFKKRIVLDDTTVIAQGGDEMFAPVARLQLNSWTLIDKDPAQLEKHQELLSLVGSGANLPKPVDNTLVSERSEMQTSLPRAAVTTRTACHLNSVHVSGKCSDLSNVGRSVRATMQKCHEQLENVGYLLSDVRYVWLDVPSMANFEIINDEYCKYFTDYPPSRACVQSCEISDSSCLSIRLFASKSSSTDVLHVRSLSKWAPVCIGPYAQANTFDSIHMLAGIIGLVPETMLLVNGGAVKQLEQSLANANAILSALRCDRTQALSCVMYVTSQVSSECIERLQNIVYMWMGDSESTQSPAGQRTGLMIFQVCALPRNADVELEILASATREESLEISNTPLTQISSHMDIMFTSTTRKMVERASLLCEWQIPSSIESASLDVRCDLAHEASNHAIQALNRLQLDGYEIQYIEYSDDSTKPKFVQENFIPALGKAFGFPLQLRISKLLSAQHIAVVHLRKHISE